MNSLDSCEKKDSLISIVDDEACVRESLSSLIRSMGYKAEDYPSAESFLSQGRWDETACLILDVRLPGMGGLELQRRLAEIEHPPIVFISGHASRREESWASKGGAVAFLRKPFSDESLLQAVQESIARRRDLATLGAMSPPTQRCPVCHEIAAVSGPPESLMRGHETARAPAVKIVKLLKQGWTEQDGLCEPCWRFYFGLGSVLNFMKSPDVSETVPEDPAAGIRKEE